MGKKKLQGADGINFQLQLTIKGLEQASFDRKPLKNQSGEEYAWIECLGGKVSAYVNLPSAIRPNNVQPFQLSDCIHLDMISQTVVEYVREYLKDNLQEHYSENILKLLTVSKMECNLTIKCIGKCKPKDVIRLFEKSFTKTTAYKEVGPDGKTYKKPETGITTSKANEWVLKVYDKTHDQRRLGNLKVEPNLVRVELVFLERMLDRMFANKKSLEDILTRKAIKTLIEQYQATFEDICEKNIKPMLDSCVQEVFESFTYSTPRKEISETLIRCKECVVDTGVLRRELKKWYAHKHMADNSKQVVAFYRDRNVGFPEDVLRTLKLMHNSL